MRKAPDMKLLDPYIKKGLLKEVQDSKDIFEYEDARLIYIHKATGYSYITNNSKLRWFYNTQKFNTSHESLPEDMEPSFHFLVTTTRKEDWGIYQVFMGVEFFGDLDRVIKTLDLKMLKIRKRLKNTEVLDKSPCNHRIYEFHHRDTGLSRWAIAMSTLEPSQVLRSAKYAMNALSTSVIKDLVVIQKFRKADDSEFDIIEHHEIEIPLEVKDRFKLIRDLNMKARVECFEKSQSTI